MAASRPSHAGRGDLARHITKRQVRGDERHTEPRPEEHHGDVVVVQASALSEAFGLTHEGMTRRDDGLLAGGPRDHRATAPGEHLRDGRVECRELRRAASG